MQIFKLGRKRPSLAARRLQLADYLSPDFPVPPVVEHWAKESPALPSLENIYGNNTLGDCVEAAAGHMIGLWRGNAGDVFPAPTAEQVIEFYSATSGYVPGDPATDQGSDEITVLNHWLAEGFFPDGSSKIAGWANVDADNELMMKQCIYLFETGMAALELPDSWINPFPSANGFVWDVAGAPNPANGHAVMAVGYNAQGIRIDSWGLLGTITWGAAAKYLTTLAECEFHAVFSADSITSASKKAPNGFDAAQLRADLGVF
jgi:hypothetical protein